jgi:hypothetical protein
VPGVSKADDNDVDLTTVNDIQVRLQITDYRLQITDYRVQMADGGTQPREMQVSLFHS